jgi:ABC-type transporter Mla subunit MlaD
MDTQYPVSIAAVTTALETIDSFVQHLTRNSDTEANDLSTLRNTFNAFSANLEEACARQLNQSLLHKRSQAPKTKLQDDIHGFNTDVDTLALAVLPKVRPQPARRHVKWTEEDENKLCDMHENGTSFKALEKVCHNRFSFEAHFTSDTHPRSFQSVQAQRSGANTTT